MPLLTTYPGVQTGTEKHEQKRRAHSQALLKKGLRSVGREISHPNLNDHVRAGVSLTGRMASSRKVKVQPVETQGGGWYPPSGASVPITVNAFFFQTGGR